MRYDILLFDADDTLFDFRLAERLALQDALSAFSIPSNEDIHRLYHGINRDMWKVFEKCPPETQFRWSTRFELLLDHLGISGDYEQINHRFSESLAEQSVLIPHAMEVCAALSQTRQLYIITNGTPSVQRRRLEKSGISAYFSDVFISGDLGARKPDPVFFRRVFSKIPNFDITRALVIGDSLSSDILGGIRAGVDTCHFNPDREKGDTKIIPTYEIHCLTRLCDIV